MKVNVQWLTVHPKFGEKYDWFYYSKDLTRDLSKCYQLLDDIAVAESEGSSWEASHYGIFELSKMKEIQKECKGLLICVD